MKSGNNVVTAFVVKICSFISGPHRENAPEVAPRSTHAMEVDEDARSQDDVARRNKLSDRELRVDLEHQYGKTNWAKKLINEMLSKRIRARAAKVDPSSNQ